MRVYPNNITLWDLSSKISSQFQNYLDFTGANYHNIIITQLLPSIQLYFINRVNPITWAGQEVLLLPVGQEDDGSSELYRGLYSEPDDLDTIVEELSEM